MTRQSGKKKPETVEFTQEAVKGYLDMCIHTWRRKRQDATSDDDEKQMAIYYVDAFQSVRVSLFGELLPA